jgi:hypothetical protein
MAAEKLSLGPGAAVVAKAAAINVRSKRIYAFHLEVGDELGGNALAFLERN